MFGVHKLVQEVVRGSLTASAREKTLSAAMRVLHFALTKKSQCLKFTDAIYNYVENMSEIKEEDKNIIIALVFNFRQLKDHITTEIKSSKGNFVHVLYRDDTFSRLNWFVDRLTGMNISFHRLRSEFAEFLLQVQGMHCQDPNLILHMMVSASLSKKNCVDSKSYEESKNLAEETVQKLRELEESGAIIEDDTKYRVLQHRASFYAKAGQWEKNYKALLELESLKLSDSCFVELQLLTGRAENFVSSCNFKSVLRRYENALKRAKRIQTPDKPTVLLALQYISCHLHNEGKLHEAKPYAEEMVDIRKAMPHDSDYYITGMIDAINTLSYFDNQKSEDMLLNILKERWPHIHKSVISGCFEANATMIEDGSDDHACRVLEALSNCLSIGMETNKRARGAKQKGEICLTVAQIALAIRKKFYGETHPQLICDYMAVIKMHEFLGNRVKAKECTELLERCKTGAATQFTQGLPPIDTNMYITRILKERGNSLFKAQDYFGAKEVYTQALSLSPNDAKLLSNRAATNVKLSEKQCSVEDKQKWLEQALDDSQKAITVDPSWVKGYYWKAVCLAHLGKRGPSLATAAVAQHLFPSNCAQITAVVDRFGTYHLQVVYTVQGLQTTIERTDIRNLVIVMKEGRYQLPEPLTIPDNSVLVGLGGVQITCSKGVPLKLNETIYMENITLSPTVESIQRLEEKAKVCLNRGQVDAAMALYNEALVSCPNDLKILTSRASVYLQFAEQNKDIPSKRKSLLQLALYDAEAAIKANPI